MNMVNKRRYKDAAARTAFLSSKGSELQLQFIVDRLNSSTMRVPSRERRANGFYGWRKVDARELQAELRLLAASWISSGKNFATVLKMNPDLQESCNDGRAMLAPNRDGKVQIAFIPRLPAHIKPARKMALQHFVNLLLNPLAEKLGGPCARCGVFFISGRDCDRVYCSRECSSAATSSQKHEEQRARERAEKLQLAQGWIERSKRERTRDWKEYVHSADRTISKNWLTRAAKTGELCPP